MAKTVEQLNKRMFIEGYFKVGTVLLQQRTQN